MTRDSERKLGHLVIIGGHEDREGDKAVLTRFMELAGGTDAKIVVITAASGEPDEMWKVYDDAFSDLGARNREHLHIESREHANNPDVVRKVAAAQGIFMTGGDQRRLLSILGGTAIDSAMHEAYCQRGVCIAGTSAGASAMSGHMLASATGLGQHEKGAVKLGAGFGLVQKVIIDQHFSERGRLPRLLTVIAQNPYLMGVGIDEDTALVIGQGTGLEVVGCGTVTIVDCRQMISDIAEVREEECPEILDVRLHLLPSGTHYALTGEREQDSAVPVPVAEFLNNVTKRIS
ncbi:cyanophycinase [Pseudoduganella sp. GCM10020061]|uniref:cyanophycinase n=1 Tax=Pseudoduganella sp. GCM10020061 TaxID=3317345 RepID=UPI00363B70F7